MLKSFDSYPGSKRFRWVGLWPGFCGITGKPGAMNRRANSRYSLIVVLITFTGIAAANGSDAVKNNTPADHEYTFSREVMEFPGIEDPVLKVYPNPASDQLNVKLQTDSPVVPEIRILDLTGKVVMEFEKPFSLSGDQFRADLDISNLNNGIYFVKVIQGQKVYTKKLVVR